jgi:hypothetical protein
MQLKKPFDMASLRVLEAKVSRNDLEPGRLSYPHLLKYFHDQEAVSEHEFIVGAHSVYGWMPRMLSIHDEDLDMAVDALRRARRSSPLAASGLSAIKAAVNRSMVGASKLLHFVRTCTQSGIAVSQPRPAFDV